MTQPATNTQCANCPELSKSKRKLQGNLQHLKNINLEYRKMIDKLKAQNTELALENRKLRGTNARKRVCPVCEDTFIAEHGNRKLCDKCRSVG